MNPLNEIKEAVQSALCSYQRKLNFKHPQDIPRPQWENQVSTHRNILELQRKASELASSHGYQLWFTHGCPHLLKDGEDCLREMFDAEEEDTAVELVATASAKMIGYEFTEEVKRLSRGAGEEAGRLNAVFAVALENLADRYMPKDYESKKLAKELRRI